MKTRYKIITIIAISVIGFLFIPVYVTHAYCDLFDSENGGCMRISGIGTGELKFYPPIFVFDENPNECWVQEDDGEIKPCVIDTGNFGLSLNPWPEQICDELCQESNKEHEKIFSSNIEKLLFQNQIDYSDKLVVTGGPTFTGDPGCGAVMDVDLQTHWFEIDSISEPRKMTVYPENPMPCKINHASCFCNAQTAYTEIMLRELSFLNPDEEKEIGKRVKTYLETMPHQIPVTKFVVGKYNLDLGEQYNEICGILLTKGDREDRFNEDYSIYKYFSAAKEGYNLWDFSLSVGSEKLCAIPANATIFEYEKPIGYNEN